MKKNLIKKMLLISTFLFVCTFISKAQIPKDALNIQSPNVASLGLFGEIPVSYFTGVPGITIPLYNLSEGGITIPISLAYHPSGFRPDQHPGWVGMGWSLSAGGVISRTVKSKPDEYVNGNPTDPGKGFYTIHNGLNTDSWSTTSYMENNIMLNNAYLHDLEPDRFTFSFFGYSGEFYLNADGQWKVKCDKPVKVSFNNEFIAPPFVPFGELAQTYGMMEAFKGFTITAEDGTRYVFGNTNDAIEYSIPFFAQNSKEWVAGAWYLTKIISPTGKEIILSYERGPYINQMNISVNNNIETYVENSSGSFLVPDCSSTYYANIGASYRGSLISPVYLKMIQTDNGKISFNRTVSTELRYSPDIYFFHHQNWQNPQFAFLPYLQEGGSIMYNQALDLLQWHKLDQLRIENNQGLIKAFNFTYNNIETERLKLLSVSEQGGNGEISGTYSFSYDESVPLPSYLSNKTDHWGFYNGTYADISDENTYYTTYFQYREPNSSFLYAGTLNKITYPTGGVTEFVYEPHSFSSQVKLDRSVPPQALGTNKLAGGLRIKKIINYADISQPNEKIEREFFYVKNYTNTANVSTLLSSGVLGGQIQYYFDDYTMPAFNDPTVTYSKKIFSSQSVLPLTNNSMGSHIGYTEVIEKREDNSYTKYTFSNFDNGYRDDPAENLLQPSRTVYEPYASREEERGKLLKEQVYNSSNHLVREKEINYIAPNKANEYVKSMKTDGFPVCPETPGVGIYECTAYKVYTYSFVPANETVRIYDDASQSITTMKEYAYESNNPMQVSSITTTNSNGEELRTKFIYPNDFPLEEGFPEDHGTLFFFDTYTNSIRKMKEKNMIGTPIETISVVKKGGVNKVSGATVNYYIEENNMILLAKKKSLKLDALISDPLEQYAPIFINTQIDIINPWLSHISMNLSSDPELQDDIIFDKYDDNGNLLELHKPNDVHIVYIYGYNKTLPIAKIENASYAQVSPHVDYLQNLSNLDVNKSSENTFRTVLNDHLHAALPDAMITTYTYDPLVGMTSETDPNGKTTYYKYDSFGRLVRVKDSEGNVLKEYKYNYAN